MLHRTDDHDPALNGRRCGLIDQARQVLCCAYQHDSPSRTTDEATAAASTRPAGRRPATQGQGWRSVSDSADPRSAGEPSPFISPPTDLLTVIGRDGRFEQLAPAFPPAFGYIEAELVEQPVVGFIHPADRAATRATLKELAQGERTRVVMNRFRCKEGSYRRLAWTALPSPEGLVYAFARDITERTQQQEQGSRSLARNEAASLAQQEKLLASSCHDLQQPLTVVLAQTEFLQRQLARGQPLDLELLGTPLKYILAAAKRMRDMTQELLDAPLQQSGRPVPLLLAKTDLVALARQAVDEYESASKLHQFLFKAEVPSLEAVVDETRLHRVLANLLTNAVKYSPHGGVVHVTVRGTDGPDGNAALLVVRDEGIGIPQDDLPHVFDRFHRGTNVVGRFAGSGLGLASARQLVELHGGSISVRSEEGRGSTFAVHLPLAPPTPDEGRTARRRKRRDRQPARRNPTR